MNLIEISEQLKDVPDNYLMKEVQVPTGAYPAYLVVSELTRRKRMRQSAMKNRPETTVTQDLTQPSREDMMAAVAKMQQSQMAPQMAQMPQQMAAQRLNAGLMATPQAADLAAQDAMAAQPVMMAGGGMADFGDISLNEQGGMVGFKSGGQVDEYGAIRAFDGFPTEMYGNGYDVPQGPSMPRKELVDQMTLQELQEYNRSGNIPSRLQEAVGGRAVESTRYDDLYSQPRAPAVQAPARVAPVAAPGSQAAQAAQSQASPFSVSSPYMTQMQQVFGDMRAMKQPTQEELAGLRAARAAEYEKAVPDRTTPMIEKIIAQQGKDIEGRRGSNINEALVQAGLGMLSSKSPSFFRAAGEGGTAGLNAYRQGTKDIRDSERLMANSQIELAKAQTLRDQGKFDQSDKATKDAMDNYKLAIDKGSTDMANLARLQAGRTQEMQTQMAAMKLPYEIAAYGVKDGLKPIDPDKADLLRAQAIRRLKERGINLEQMLAKDSQRLVDEEMLSYNRILQRGVLPAPVVRGSQNAPLGAS
jgi:hypothetical protein